MPQAHFSLQNHHKNELEICDDDALKMSGSGAESWMPGRAVKHRAILKFDQKKETKIEVFIYIKKNFYI